MALTRANFTAFLISRSFHPSVVQDCWIGGFGRFTEAELLVFARQDLDALAHFLGDKKFIFGDDFHEVDASVYGTVAQFFNIPIDTPLHALAKEYKTLHAYYQRISEHIESLPALVKCQQ
jgi:glutathione S-transferase